MKRLHMTLAIAGAAVALAAGLWTATPAQEPAAAPAMDKPLDQFTLGDLFPNLGGTGMEQTATAWQTAGQGLLDVTTKRTQAIQAAIPKIQAAVTQAKNDSKAAEKSKDFNASGAAEGKMRTAEIVKKVLEGIQDVTEKQMNAAKAMVAAGQSMAKMAEADKAFDPYRAKGISKPDKPGDPDNRMDAAGVQVFKQHAEAIKDLAKKMGDLSAQMGTLASERLAFLADLEKGGHIQTPPVK